MPAFRENKKENIVSKSTPTMIQVIQDVLYLGKTLRYGRAEWTQREIAKRLARERGLPIYASNGRNRA